MKSRRGLIINYFKPSIYVRSFNDVNISLLKRQGIKLFICDLDNTLVPHYTKLPNKNVLNFIKRVNDSGIKFVIMSNNTRNRVRLFSQKANVKHYYGNAKKPFKKVAKKIIQAHKVLPSETIIMGDQIVLDILVANRLKCESILVQPLVSTDYKMNWFNIFLEKTLYKKLEKKNILLQKQFAFKKTHPKIELL